MDTCRPVPPSHSRAGVAAGFRAARESAGLSPRELASALGTSTAAILALESDDNELFAAYSLTEVRLIAAELGTSPAALLKCPQAEASIQLAELISLIRIQLMNNPEQFRAFESELGRRISALLESPRTLVDDLTVDALQRVCAFSEVDCCRLVVGLEEEQ